MVIDKENKFSAFFSLNLTALGDELWVVKTKTEKIFY